jgi:hypothetical protein
LRTILRDPHVRGFTPKSCSNLRAQTGIAYWLDSHSAFSTGWGITGTAPGRRSLPGCCSSWGAFPLMGALGVRRGNEEVVAGDRHARHGTMRSPQHAPPRSQHSHGSPGGVPCGIAPACSADKRTDVRLSSPYNLVNLAAERSEQNRAQTESSQATMPMVVAVTGTCRRVDPAGLPCGRQLPTQR